MGQGTYTGMAVLVAEELEADWKDVRVVQADADPRYGQMSTGGSSQRPPVLGAAPQGRRRGAGDAGRRGGRPLERRPGLLPRRERARSSTPPPGAALGYGALAAAAREAAGPGEAAASRTRRTSRLIGKPVPRLDTPPKTRGAAVFGIDVRVPGMLHAVVARPPALGGKVARFDAAEGAWPFPDVRKVVEVPSGVAVLADTTWAAFRGRDALAATFDGGPERRARLGGHRPAASTRRSREPTPARSEGDLEKALAGAAKKLSATYTLPFLAHATMEPMNCTARVDGNGAELWVPTQAPLWARGDVAKALGLPDDKVTVHTTFLGGGFGRRSFPDFPVEAALVAKAAGVPVQVTWSREDDFLGDYFRPCGKNELRAGLDAKGNLVAWHHLVRSPSISRQNFGGRPRQPRRPGGGHRLPLPDRRHPDRGGHPHGGRAARLVALGLRVAERLPRGVLRRRAGPRGGQGPARLPAGAPAPPTTRSRRCWRWPGRSRAGGRSSPRASPAGSPATPPSAATWPRWPRSR